jgi:hypothetical protein
MWTRAHGRVQKAAQKFQVLDAFERKRWDFAIALGNNAMLKTPLCDLFGIEMPIILAPMGTCTSAELAAAVCNEGGLGGIGTLFRSIAAIKRDIDVLRTLTSRPFAINHIPQALDAEDPG